MTTPPRFNIADAQTIISNPLKNLNNTVKRIEREKKLAKIRETGTYVGIILGAAATAYVVIKKQSKSNEED
jgi:hypothetical protein